MEIRFLCIKSFVLLLGFDITIIELYDHRLYCGIWMSSCKCFLIVRLIMIFKY